MAGAEAQRSTVSRRATTARPTLRGSIGTVSDLSDTGAAMPRLTTSDALSTELTMASKTTTISINGSNSKALEAIAARAAAKQNVQAVALTTLEAQRDAIVAAMTDAITVDMFTAYTEAYRVAAWDALPAEQRQSKNKASANDLLRWLHNIPTETRIPKSGILKTDDQKRLKAAINFSNHVRKHSVAAILAGVGSKARGKGKGKGKGDKWAQVLKAVTSAVKIAAPSDAQRKAADAALAALTEYVKAHALADAA